MLGKFRKKMKVSGKLMEEYKQDRSNRNFKTCKILSLVLFLMFLVLIFVDLYFFKLYWEEIPSYKNLYFLHMCYVFIFILFYLLIYLKNKFNVFNKSFITYFFITIVLVWCILLSINDQLLNKQLSAYIICAFALASYIKLNPIESFLLYALSIIVFIFGLFHIDAPDIPFSIINSSILVLLAYSVSIINYYADFKDFINEKTIREKNIELEKHDRMKNIFFGNITHELRTPINLIYSAEQMLYKCVNNDSKNIQKKNILNKYLKMIKQNSFRLMRLINNIIDSSRMDFGEYKLNIKNYDIVDITRKIAASVSAYVELNNIHFSYNTNLNKIFIACDPDAIERILLNLISNAVKNTEENASINVSLYLEKEYVVISVKDTGIGIPKEEQKVIFNRFVQADNSISQKTVGSGIGLSLVNYLVKMHDGEIDLKSTPGKGSEFIIKIPNDIIEDEKVSEDKDSGREEINEKIRLEFSDIYLD